MCQRQRQQRQHQQRRQRQRQRQQRQRQQRRQRQRQQRTLPCCAQIKSNQSSPNTINQQDGKLPNRFAPVQSLPIFKLKFVGSEALSKSEI